MTTREERIRSNDPGDLLRAVRRSRRLSQRDLSAVTGVPTATIERIEAARSANPGIRTIRRILAATGYEIVYVNAALRPLLVEDCRFNPLDRGGRYYPAHLDLREVRSMRDPWWGWYRVAFYDRDPKAVRWTFDRGPQHVWPYQLDARWDEAT